MSQKVAIVRMSVEIEGLLGTMARYSYANYADVRAALRKLRTGPHVNMSARDKELVGKIISLLDELEKLER